MIGRERLLDRDPSAVLIVAVDSEGLEANAEMLNPGVVPYRFSDDVRGDSCSRPVWPVMNDSELAALQATVELFDGRLVQMETSSFVESREVPSASGTMGNASILYPSSVLRPLAELYARLTSRVAKLAPLDRAGRTKPEIVLCLWEHLDIQTLETLQRAAMRRPVGLIVAETLAELRIRVLRYAAAATLAPPTTGAALILEGSQQEPRRPRLVKPAGALGAIVHAGRGDGLDYRVSEQEVLCAVARRTTRQVPSAAPCVIDGHCYRLRTPMASARQSLLLLDTGELRARAVVLLTCFGVPSSDSLVPPTWSLLEGLLSNPGIACVATSLGVAMPTETDTAAVGDALRAGLRIGDAIYRNPDLSREAHERCRMLLFGDPRTRPLRQAPRLPLAKRLPPLPRPARPKAWARSARHRFLDELLASARPDQLEAAALDDAGLVEHLAELPPLWEHWTKAFRPPRPTRDPATCPGCGRPGRSFVAQWRREDLLRVISTCTRCGVFRDIEPGSALDRSPALLRGTSLEIPDAVADARVLIRYQDALRGSRGWVLPPGRGRRQNIAWQGQRLVSGTGLATLSILYVLELEIASWQFAVVTKPL